MLNKQIAERYARALFNLGVEEGNLEELKIELGDIVDLIESNQEIGALLSHPKLSNGQKKEILGKILEGKVTDTMSKFINLLIDKGRIDCLMSIYQRLKEQVDAKKNRLEVEVSSPVNLSKKYQQKLRSKLESITNKEVSLNLVVKPELLGGLILKVGDKIIDGSLVNHLKKLENKLKSLEVSQLGVKIDES